MKVRKKDKTKVKDAKKNLFYIFPSSEMWRLGMEITRQDEGPEAFHRGEKPEPGYMQGITNGYALILERDEKLSADMLAQIHDICVKPIRDDHIFKIETSYRQEIVEYGLRFFELDPRTGYVSKEGFFELLDKMKQHEKT